MSQNGDLPINLFYTLDGNTQSEKLLQELGNLHGTRKAGMLPGIGLGFATYRDPAALHKTATAEAVALVDRELGHKQYRLVSGLDPCWRRRLPGWAVAAPYVVVVSSRRCAAARCAKQLYSILVEKFAERRMNFPLPWGHGPDSEARNRRKTHERERRQRKHNRVPLLGIGRRSSS